MHTDRASSTRFPVPVDAALRAAGWQPGRWDIQQAEIWADTLRGHISPAGHLHAVFPAAVEAWAEFGGLRITPTGTGRQVAPTAVHLDPLHGLHLGAAPQVEQVADASGANARRERARRAGAGDHA